MNKFKWIVGVVICFLGLISKPLFAESLSTEEHAACDDIGNEVFSDGLCTKIRTFKSENLSDSPYLLVTLHGDDAFIKQSYQYRFAQIIAEDSKNLIAVGMLRPGYIDQADRISDGDRGFTVGDNYDKKRVQQIAASIDILKKYHNSSKVILAGHSGGAAITANLISLYPELIDYAVLVSCPCDLDAWRSEMYKKTQAFPFNTAAHHEYGAMNNTSPIDLVYTSPIDLVNEVSENTMISIFVGESDDNTKPYLSERYSVALKKTVKDVEFKMVSGGHNIFLSAPVISNVLSIVN